MSLKKVRSSTLAEMTCVAGSWRKKAMSELTNRGSDMEGAFSTVANTFSSG